MKSLSHNIKRFLFSEKCCICNKILKEDGYICRACLFKLKGMSFLKKEKDIYFFYYYEDIKNLIWDFKFNNRRGLSEQLATLFGDSLKNLIEELEIDIVVPVPVSKERYKERGFNQVEEFLNSLGIKFQKIERIKNTRHMYEIDKKEERERNLQSAFSSKICLRGKKILLVDDIVTTGTTLNAIREEIKNLYPKEMYIFSISVVKSYLKKNHNDEVK